MSAPVVIVHLRQPKNRRDVRTDPLYEFGSFGLTGCHHSNLLADDSLAGFRLAFAQGGEHGFRLVMLTPTVEVHEWMQVREASWKPPERPLRYETAPVLIDNDGSSDVEGMRELLAEVDRNTWREKFSSSFRSRKQPLDARLAAAVVYAWDHAIERGAQPADAYWEALPYWDAGFVDHDRHSTHERLLGRARGEAAPTDPIEDNEHDDEQTETRSSCEPGRESVSKPPSRGC
jgi:hypothetical protein